MQHGLSTFSTLLALCLLDEPAQGALSFTAARPYVESASVAFPTVLPVNVTVPDDDSAEIGRMLIHSPTFRQQCARIGRARALRVMVKRAVPTALRGGSALTTVFRGPHGRPAEAHVYIAAGGDLVQLLAHEFEHILEQLDGVDLEIMASRSGTGVDFDRSTLRYETARAIGAGQRVAAEVSSARR